MPAPAARLPEVGALGWPASLEVGARFERRMHEIAPPPAFMAALSNSEDQPLPCQTSLLNAFSTSSLLVNLVK